MPDYEFFLRVLPPEYTFDRPQSLWRRAGERWEYLSLLDWSWHELGERTVRLPDSDELVPVTAGRAEQLAADRQFWVRYWAVEDWPPPHGTGEPYTVVRLRSDPRGDHEEVFSQENRWGTSTVLAEHHWGDLTPLREIDRDEAEAILQRLRGVPPGVTEL